MKIFGNQKWSLVLLAIFAFLTVYAFFFAKDIKIDHDFDKFFTQEDQQIKYLHQYIDKYGQDADFILVGIEPEGKIFDKKFLKKIKELGDRIQTQSHVLDVFSPCHNCFVAKWGGIEGIVEKPCISFEDLEADSIKLASQIKLQGTLFSNEKPAVLLYVKTQENLTMRYGADLQEYIQTQLFSLDLPKYHIAGKIIATAHYIERIEEELGIFLAASVLLICLFLWFTFRSFWGILVPLIIVVASTIWTLAIMQITGKSLDLLMIILPTIIFVVGMSDLIHFLNKYLEELRLGRVKSEAIGNSFKEVGLATLLTSVTTAVGFFSLIAVDIEPVKEFGIYSGIAIFVAYFLTFSCTPFILTLLPVPIDLMVQNHKRQWNDSLGKIFIWVLRNPKKILTAATGVVLFGIVGLNGLNVNAYLLDDLTDDDPVKQNFSFFEENFAGVRPFEMEINVKDSSRNIYDYEIAKEVYKIEQYLAKHYTPDGVGFMFSLLDPIKLFYFIKHNNNPDYYKLPKEKAYYNNLRLLEKYIPSAKLHNVLVSQDSVSGRISGKIHDVGSKIIEEENQKFLQFMRDSINNELVETRFTGTAFFVDKNNENLSMNLLTGLLLALSIVGILMGFIYKSWIVVLVALLTNLLPLLFISGFMYLVGFDIKISTSLIFTLAFGIAVDDTIHLLSKLKIEMNKGASLFAAMKQSYLTTGKAIVITSLVLCGGFLSLLFSNFSSTFTLGLLVSITLAVAVIVDLTVLPILLLASKRFLDK